MLYRIKAIDRVSRRLRFHHSCLLKHCKVREWEDDDVQTITKIRNNIAFPCPGSPAPFDYYSREGGAVRKETKDVADEQLDSCTTTGNLFSRGDCVIKIMTSPIFPMKYASAFSRGHYIKNDSRTKWIFRTYLIAWYRSWCYTWNLKTKIPYQIDIHVNGMALYSLVNLILYMEDFHGGRRRILAILSPFPHTLM